VSQMFSEFNRGLQRSRERPLSGVSLIARTAGCGPK
jgi:hypothetical protein